MDNQTKLELYKKILMDEFARELHFFMDVSSGRSKAKADFTDKLFAIFKKASRALDLVPIGDWLSSALKLIMDSVNEGRKEKKIKHIVTEGYKIDWLRLRIILDVVSLEAARRYQQFITETLSDDPIKGIVPFARTGVERMLSYLIAHDLSIEEEHLVNGFMHGLSGKWVSGYMNTKLESKKKGGKYTAEGAYARSGISNISGDFFKKGKETKLKYGYMLLPQAVINQSGATPDPGGQLSNYYPTWVSISKDTLCAYLDANGGNKQSLLQFIQGELHYPAQHSITRVFYVADAKDGWDLSDLNFQESDLSHTVFNHCVFGNSLDGTQFNDGYLISANITKTDSAKGASFRNAHMEFIEASSIDLKGSDLSQAHCEYANMEGSDLRGCQIIGIAWDHASIDGIKLDGAIELKESHDEESGNDTFRETVSIHQGKIEALENELKALQKAIEENQEGKELLLELQALVIDTLEAQRSLFVYQRHCNLKLIELEDKASKAFKSTEQKLAKLNKRDETLAARVDEMTQKLIRVNKQLESNTLDIEALRQDLLEFQKRVGDLELKIDGIDKVVGELQEQFRQVEKGAVKDISDKVKELIVQRYSADNEIQGVFGKPLSMEAQEGYVNLQMIFSGKIENKEENTAKESNPRDQRISSFEDLFGEKRVLTLADMFKPANDILKEGDRKSLRLEHEDPKESPRVLFIEGRAGIGKTTCVRHIAHQWAQGKLFQDIKYLFVLNFRELRGGALLETQKRGEQLALWEWVYHHRHLIIGGKRRKEAAFPFRSEGVEVQDFKHFFQKLIEEKGDKVAFILDGLDEKPSESACEGALDALLNSAIYNKSKVLITSRPGTGGLLPKKRREVEVVGFTDDNIKQYMNEYFIGTSQAGQVKNMLSMLQGQPTLWGISHIPVNLNMLCGLFEKEDIDISDMQSMSRIYQNMEFQLLIRSAKKDKDFERIYLESQYGEKAKEVYALHIQVLALLALEGLQTQQIILPMSWLDKLIVSKKVEKAQVFKTELLDLGFMKQDNEGNLEFIHLTFQEYYAALAVVSGLERPEESQATLRFIDETLFDPRYQVLFWLVFGLSRDNPKVLEALLLRIIEGESRDLIGEHGLGLLIRGLEEVMPEMGDKYDPCPIKNLSKKTQKKLFDAIMGRFNTWFLGYGQDTLVDVGNSLFFRMLAISSKVSKHLSQRKDNQAISSMTTRFGTPTRSGIRRATYFFYLANYHQSRVLNILEKGLKTASTDMRKVALMGIGLMGERVATPEILEALLGALQDKDESVRHIALNAITHMGEHAVTLEVLKALFGILQDKELYAAELALIAIESMGEHATTPDILKGILAALQDKEWRVRKAALKAIGAMGKHVAAEVLEALLGALQDKDKNVKEAALRAIGTIGEHAATPEILEEILAALQDKGLCIREEALNTIRHMDEHVATSEILPRVLVALQDKESDVREAALRAIRSIGKYAATPEILKALLGALQDKESGFRAEALDTIGAIGEKAATPEILKALLGALEDKDKNIRVAVLNAIGSMGEHVATPEVLKALLGALQNKESDVKEAASIAIGAMGDRAATPEILQWLLDALQNKESDVKEAGTPEILQRLLDAFSGIDGLSCIHSAALYTIGNMGEHAATDKILEALLVGLQDKESGFRAEALDTIGAIGEKAATPDILKGILVALQDKEWRIRKAAFEAIKKLEDYIDISALINNKEEICPLLFLFSFINRKNSALVSKDSTNGEFTLKVIGADQYKEYKITEEKARWLYHCMPEWINELLSNNKNPLEVLKSMGSFRRKIPEVKASDVSMFSIGPAFSANKLFRDPHSKSGEGMPKPV